MKPASSDKAVRVRIAPSPSGPFHIGTARTALFNWLFARQHKGTFIVRIEDTDTTRSEKQWEDQILEGLSWLGISWDEGPIQGKSTYVGDFGPYRQSERIELYKKYLEKLLADGKAYYCYCTKEELEAERQAMMSQGLPPKYGGHCRNIKEPPAGKNSQLIRFKTPEAIVEFKDMIRGKVSFDAGLFGDLGIARDLEHPLYNFAVVIDDHEMNISHVIRGEDHISNTPKQILFQKAMGIEEPIYAHLPLILNADRSKLSKRFGDTSLFEYRDRGFLPQALLNFLALLGWHPGDNQDVLDAKELIEKFDLKRVQKAGAIFNNEKLEWLNREHMKKLSVDELFEKLQPILKARSIKAPEKFVKRVIEIERGRIKTLQDFIDVAGFFFELPSYEKQMLVWQKSTAEQTQEVLTELMAIFKTLPAVLTQDIILNALTELFNHMGKGTVFWPLRVALSGLAASPDPLEIAEILDNNEVQRRLQIAIEKLRT